MHEEPPMTDDLNVPEPTTDPEPEAKSKPTYTIGTLITREMSASWASGAGTPDEPSWDHPTSKPGDATE